MGQAKRGPYRTHASVGGEASRGEDGRDLQAMPRITGARWRPVSGICPIRVSAKAVQTENGVADKVVACHRALKSAVSMYALYVCVDIWEVCL
jgi:hypothetical protein